MKSTQDYLDCCSAAEVEITVTDAGTRDLIKNALEYNESKLKGGAGRQLKRALPSLGLLSGDRLEPTPTLPNVSDLDKVQAFPINDVFWRRFPTAIGYRRNPLLAPHLGLGLEAFAVDAMH